MIEADLGSFTDSEIRIDSNVSLRRVALKTSLRNRINKELIQNRLGTGWPGVPSPISHN